MHNSRTRYLEFCISWNQLGNTSVDSRRFLWNNMKLFFLRGLSSDFFRTRNPFFSISANRARFHFGTSSHYELSKLFDNMLPGTLFSHLCLELFAIRELRLMKKFTNSWIRNIQSSSSISQVVLTRRCGGCTSRVRTSPSRRNYAARSHIRSCSTVSLLMMETTTPEQA